MSVITPLDLLAEMLSGCGWTSAHVVDTGGKCKAVQIDIPEYRLIAAAPGGVGASAVTILVSDRDEWCGNPGWLIAVDDQDELASVDTFDEILPVLYRIAEWQFDRSVVWYCA